MRRMYSEKELTTIINQVVGEYIEAGALDESIADAVDAYLVEHPVDITALEGQDISLATLTSTGDVDVGGNLDVTGSINGAEIIEIMSGYSNYQGGDSLSSQVTLEYVGVVKNGNKLTFVKAGYITGDGVATNFGLGGFSIPATIGAKLYPLGVTANIDVRRLLLYKENAATSSVESYGYVVKDSNAQLRFGLIADSTLEDTKKFFFRYEVTFLLSENLIGA